jgi:hypothetical protein
LELFRYNGNGGRVCCKWESVPVAASAGAFSFNVDFAAEEKYPVVITATDAGGNKSSVTRNVIYDKTPQYLF